MGGLERMRAGITALALLFALPLVFVTNDADHTPTVVHEETLDTPTIIHDAVLEKGHKEEELGDDLRARKCGNCPNGFKTAGREPEMWTEKVESGVEIEVMQKFCECEQGCCSFYDSVMGKQKKDQSFYSVFKTKPRGRGIKSMSANTKEQLSKTRNELVQNHMKLRDQKMRQAPKCKKKKCPAKGCDGCWDNTRKYCFTEMSDEAICKKKGREWCRPDQKKKKCPAKGCDGCWMSKEKYCIIQIPNEAICKKKAGNEWCRPDQKKKNCPAKGCNGCWISKEKHCIVEVPNEAICKNKARGEWCRPPGQDPPPMSFPPIKKLGSILTGGLHDATGVPRRSRTVHICGHLSSHKVLAKGACRITKGNEGKYHIHSGTISCRGISKSSEGQCNSDEAEAAALLGSAEEADPCFRMETGKKPLAKQLDERGCTKLEERMRNGLQGKTVTSSFRQGSCSVQVCQGRAQNPRTCDGQTKWKSEFLIDAGSFAELGEEDKRGGKLMMKGDVTEDKGVGVELMEGLQDHGSADVDLTMRRIWAEFRIGAAGLQ